jgi:thiamine-phosphate pyrophosphorylase
LPGYFKIEKINRIIDANINRAKEGLRVCEEIARFILDSRLLTSELKKIRHEIDALVKYFPDTPALLNQRKSGQDVGRNIHSFELKRAGLYDIFFANIQRVKESVRVLEEFAKLQNAKAALGFKRLRYAVYETEKKIAGKIPALRHFR